MTSLIIDTAFDSCQVGLWQNDTCITMASVPGGGKHDVVLAPLVQEMLRVHDVKIKDLAEIIVTTGPGRFTGLRVGIAFARGLALVHKTPLKGVLTTDALRVDLQAAFPDAESVAAIVTVKRGESFIQRFKPETGAITRVTDAELGDYFAAGEKTLLAGVVSPEVREMIEKSNNVSYIDSITEPSLQAIYKVSQQTAAQESAVIRPYYAV